MQKDPYPVQKKKKLTSLTALSMETQIKASLFSSHIPSSKKKKNSLLIA
jgi:hypothetical protein